MTTPGRFSSSVVPPWLWVWLGVFLVLLLFPFSFALQAWLLRLLRAMGRASGIEIVPIDRVASPQVVSIFWIVAGGLLALWPLLSPRWEKLFCSSQQSKALHPLPYWVSAGVLVGLGLWRLSCDAYILILLDVSSTENDFWKNSLIIPSWEACAELVEVGRGGSIWNKKPVSVFRSLLFVAILTHPAVRQSSRRGPPGTPPRRGCGQLFCCMRFHRTDVFLDELSPVF